MPVLYEFFVRVEFFCLRCEMPFTADMHVAEHNAAVAKCPSCGKKDKVQRVSPFTAVPSRTSAGY
jgi:DNA-directed RNA polymerase subunit RPC12/RpoP